MPTNLAAVRDALEGLTDIELRALQVAANEVPQVAPGLLAWVAAACDWELNRRVGRNYDLHPPAAAIGPSGDAVAIGAVRAMRESFTTGPFAPAVLKFFDALASLMAGAER